MKFAEFIFSRLGDSQPHLYAIGEHHGFIPHAIMALLLLKPSANNKRFCVILEGVPAQGEAPYSRKHFLRQITPPWSDRLFKKPLHPFDVKGAKYHLALIDAGFDVFGAETSQSDPFLYPEQFSKLSQVVTALKIAGCSCGALEKFKLLLLKSYFNSDNYQLDNDGFVLQLDTLGNITKRFELPLQKNTTFHERIIFYAQRCFLAEKRLSRGTEVFIGEIRKRWNQKYEAIFIICGAAHIPELRTKSGDLVDLGIFGHMRLDPKQYTDLYIPMSAKTWSATNSCYQFNSEDGATGTFRYSFSAQEIQDEADEENHAPKIN